MRANRFKQAILSAFSNVVVCANSVRVFILLYTKSGFYQAGAGECIGGSARLRHHFHFSRLHSTVDDSVWRAHVTIYSNSIPCQSREVFYYLIIKKRKQKYINIYRYLKREGKRVSHNAWWSGWDGAARVGQTWLLGTRNKLKTGTKYMHFAYIMCNVYITYSRNMPMCREAKPISL